MFKVDNAIAFPCAGFGGQNCMTLRTDLIEHYQQYSFECTVTSDGNTGEGSTKTCSADLPANGELSVTPGEG